MSEITEALAQAYAELRQAREAAQALRIQLLQARKCQKCCAVKKCPYEGITHV